MLAVLFVLLSSGREGARTRRRLLPLLAVGWLPPSVPPSGAGRMRGPRVPCGLVTLPRVTPHRGGASADARWTPGEPWLPPAAVFRLAVSRELDSLGNFIFCV